MTADVSFVISDGVLAFLGGQVAGLLVVGVRSWLSSSARRETEAERDR